MLLIHTKPAKQKKIRETSHVYMLLIHTKPAKQK